MDGLIASPALPDWVPRRALDVDAYHGMAAAGILAPDDRVELIEGELVWMAALGGPHIGCVMALTHLLLPILPPDVRLSIQSSVRLGRHSEPQPDVAVLRPRPDRYRGSLPPLAEDVLLLIEVADSSLRFDREVKARLYAQHGIPDYWVVDLGGRVVLAHREPTAAGYQATHERRAGEMIETVALPDIKLAVDDILG